MVRTCHALEVSSIDSTVNPPLPSTFAFVIVKPSPLLLNPTQLVSRVLLPFPVKAKPSFSAFFLAIAQFSGSGFRTTAPAARAGAFAAFAGFAIPPAAASLGGKAARCAKTSLIVTCPFAPVPVTSAISTSTSLAFFIAPLVALTSGVSLTGSATFALFGFAFSTAFANFGGSFVAFASSFFCFANNAACSFFSFATSFLLFAR